MTEQREVEGASSANGRRRFVFLLIGATALAWAVLAFPYARALWWLHVDRQLPAELVIPVAGVAADQLEATFGAPRGDHAHEGIDILAPAGTPVLAAAEGVVIGNRQTAIGGVVLWILGGGRRLYYYAHMRELAPGMLMGRKVGAGEQLGTVGNTGNAIHTPPHLHFAIYRVMSSFYPMRYYAVDPYPVLTATRTK
jgi:murein DD-endopeptidase MepM/ murein hydrolase activator NlpD